MMDGLGWPFNLLPLFFRTWVVAIPELLSLSISYYWRSYILIYFNLIIIQSNKSIFNHNSIAIEYHNYKIKIQQQQHYFKK